MGLNPQVSNSGGTLAGGQALYYGISAVDANGAEGGLSFIAIANVPAGANTNQVTLVSLSFSSAAVSFNVYRGPNPTQILRIASGVAIATQFVDSGLTASLQGPPDPNYDHANFYWRLELQPPEAVNITSATTVGNSTLNMVVNLYNGATVRINDRDGSRAGANHSLQHGDYPYHYDAMERPAGYYEFLPDRRLGLAVWSFQQCVAGFLCRAESRRSDHSCFRPRRQRRRTKNARMNCRPLRDGRSRALAAQLSTPMFQDSPVFGFYAIGAGSIEVLGIAFTDLTNTRSISAGTLTLAYWDELQGPSTILLSAAMGATDTSFTVATAVSASSGDLVQIDAEVMVVQQNRDEQHNGARHARLSRNHRRGTHGFNGRLPSCGEDLHLAVRAGFLWKPGQRELCISDHDSRRPDCSGRAVYD